MVDIPHNFKSGYTRPFRANCTRCGKTRQDPLHDLSYYSCPNCGFDTLLRIAKRCIECHTVIDWSDVQ